MSVARLLEGIRILDLADESGALAGKLLADLGADVVRVEPPGGSAIRHRGPFVDGKPGPETSLRHLHLNRNKRSVILDLETEASPEKLRSLAESADALIETARPGAMDELGIGHESLKKHNPRLVYVTITPFGQHGPFREYRGNDLTGAASSGFMYLNGFPEDPPNVPGGQQAFNMASLVAASSTLAALVGRGSDGVGRRIDISVQEAASMATIQTANANIYTWHGRVPRRVGNVSGIQKCRDGKWVSFVLRTGSQETWSDMAQWLRDEEIDTPVYGEEWRDERYRIQNRRAVTEAITALCNKHDRDYIFHEGQRRKQLIMPVNDVAGLLEDAQLQDRQFFTEIEHPELGRTFTDTGLPYRFSGVQPVPSRRAPLLGEHTAEVLRQTTSGHAERQPAAKRDYDPARPLAGVRVADFSWMIAGPAASRMLADLGAEVIKIESEYRLDNIRVVGVQPPDGGGIDSNGVFMDCNTNKVSVRINVNNPRGRELAKEIIKRSDLVLNNYTAERMPKWGLGYEDLRQLKPDIISLSMPVMGCTGPYRNYGSYGNGIVAFSGINMSTGFPERPPVGLGPLYSDFAGPYLVVTALMAALIHRDRTGEGQFIDFSQVEATTNLLGHQVLEYSANGDLPRRLGNRSPDYAPHGAFRCDGEDRWIALAVEIDREWHALAEAMGKPELATDTRFVSHEARKANEDELEAIVNDWTSGQDAWDLMHLLQGKGVMAAVVEDLEDMCDRDPWMSTEHLIPVTSPTGLAFRTRAQPVLFDGKRPPLKPAPLFGEHTDAVLKGLLGLSQEQVEELVVEGAVY